MLRKYFKNSVQVKAGQSFYFLISFIFSSGISSAQTWENTFGGTGMERGFKMIETYDNGFATLGLIGSSSNQQISLIKVDINGNILWNKVIGSSNNISVSPSIDKTNDGGFILAGYTTQYDSQGAAFVLKLDECGEKQWCKIFGLPNDYDLSACIYQLTDGSYIVLSIDFGTTAPNTDRVGLMKLDTIGNIIWFNDYSHYGNPSATALILTNDNGFLITGRCYTQNFGDTTGPAWIRTFVTKVDSSGSEEWAIPFGLTDHFYSGGGASRETPNEGFLTLCTYKDSVSNYKYWPYLFKVDANGNVQWKTLIGDTTKRQEVFDILALNDSASVTLTNIADTISGSAHQLKLLKLDTAGTVLDSISYGYCDFTPTFSHLSKTRDNKILVCSTKYLGGSNYDIYALKLNEHLHLDTMYNISLNYDSLCSTGITSGFISLDTMSYVGVEEIAHKEGEFLLYPNPATKELRIKNAELRIERIEVLDLLGKVVLSAQPVTSNRQQVTSIDVSALLPGIYFVKVQSANQTITRKLVISR